MAPSRFWLTFLLIAVGWHDPAGMEMGGVDHVAELAPGAYSAQEVFIKPDVQSVLLFMLT
jgi:hypothetical protein